MAKPIIYNNGFGVVLNTHGKSRFFLKGANIDMSTAVYVNGQLATNRKFYTPDTLVCKIVFNNYGNGGTGESAVTITVVNGSGSTSEQSTSTVVVNVDDDSDT